ncbi:dihydroorotate dehydrogenase (quinone), mitochondrial-like [Lasioglossum baleicum]|uniref:dihydroorotate dehydrogenase (quinone), mitochondrial-like n=1 Tax=Lasioglossum baleicum TaxID=434251 RepID=UPI003FCCAA4A
MARRLSGKDKLKSLLTVTSTAVTLYGGICLYQSDEKFYNRYAVPLIRLVDPELAHNAAIKMLKWGLVGKQTTTDPCSLETNVWGMQFNNPLGMAAGFDKQA